MFMDWNLFNLKIQTLCIIKNINLSDLKKEKFSFVQNELLRLGLI